MITNQTEVDYINSAQLRVAADTRVLKKRTTLTVPAGSTTTALPIEVIRLEGLYNGTEPLVQVTVSDYLGLATQDVAGFTGDVIVFCVVGRTLYIWPSLAAATSLTAFYSYRPTVIDSGATLELSGQAERLVERLASAYALLDDGQPEVAQSELAAYLTDAGRVRRQEVRSEGGNGMVNLVGRVRR